MTTPFKLRSGSSPFKQNLSPKAAAAKAKRDQEAAMSPWGKYKKRTAQQEDCKPGYDYDHQQRKCVPQTENRSNNSRSGSVQSSYGY